MKKKFKITVLSIVLLILIATTATLGIQKFLTGDEEKRELALVSLMWELNEQGYTKSDVKDIYVTYNPNVLSYPYSVNVVFSDNPERNYIYGWDDEEGLREMGNSASIDRN